MGPNDLPQVVAPTPDRLRPDAADSQSVLLHTLANFLVPLAALRGIQALPESRAQRLGALLARGAVAETVIEYAGYELALSLLPPFKVATSKIKEELGLKKEAPSVFPSTDWSDLHGVGTAIENRVAYAGRVVALGTLETLRDARDVVTYVPRLAYRKIVDEPAEERHMQHVRESAQLNQSLRDVLLGTLQGSADAVPFPPSLGGLEQNPQVGTPESASIAKAAPTSAEMAESKGFTGIAHLVDRDGRSGIVTNILLEVDPRTGLVVSRSGPDRDAC